MIVYLMLAVGDAWGSEEDGGTDQVNPLLGADRGLTTMAPAAA